MITSDDIRHQITQSLTDHVDEFDVDLMTADFISRFGRVDIDTIDGDVYWPWVQTWDVGT